MTDPAGIDRRLEDSPGRSTGDDHTLDPGADVPLSRDEAIRRDAARPDPEQPVRADRNDDVPDNGPGIAESSPRPRRDT
jgi:hypothetical protein